MGCGNSSPTNNSSSSSSTAGRAESSSKGSDESVPEDDKWKNYGGVYVGFPTDLSNIPQVQIGSLRVWIRNVIYPQSAQTRRCVHQVWAEQLP